MSLFLVLLCGVYIGTITGRLVGRWEARHGSR